MNENRRNFLKFVFFGAIVLVLSRFVNFFKINEEGKAAEDGATKIGENFRAVERNGRLVFTNKKGDQVFSLTDAGEMEIGD